MSLQIRLTLGFPGCRRLCRLIENVIDTKFSARKSSLCSGLIDNSKDTPLAMIPRRRDGESALTYIDLIITPVIRAQGENERLEDGDGKGSVLEFPAIASSQRESFGAMAPRVTSSHHLRSPDRYTHLGAAHDVTCTKDLCTLYNDTKPSGNQLPLRRSPFLGLSHY